MSKSCRAIGVGIVLPLAIFGWLVWNINRPPFDLRELDRLHLGMSEAEVLRVLGKPTSDFGDNWAYSRFMAWPIVYVYFDDQGKLLRQEYDH